MRIPYDRIVHYVYHHHIGIIVVSTLVSLIAGLFTVQLFKNIKTDFADLLPEDYVSVRELNRIKERVGGVSPLIVVITGDDLNQTVEFMLALADALERNPLLSGVGRGKNQAFRTRNQLLYIDLEGLQEIHSRVADYIEEQKLKRNPLYFSLEEDEEAGLDFSDIEARYKKGKDSEGLEKYYYLTQEKNGVILSLYPTGVITDLIFTKQLLQSIEKTIVEIDPKSYHPSIEYFFEGSFRNASRQYDIVLHDLKSTALYGFIGVLLLISLYFRQILASLFIVFPLLMSISWTFGLTYLAIGSLNLITVCLFAILFGLGIDFGIHIFARYREARRRGLSSEPALSETVCDTGSALTTTAATTAVAFFSLTVTDFKGFSEFGFIVGTGILFSLVAMLIICPAFIVLAERLKAIRLKQKTIPPHLLRRGAYPLPLVTLALGVLATVYSLYHLNSLEFEYDFNKLKPPKPQPETQASLPQTLKDTRSPAIILTESPDEAREVVETVRQIKESKGSSSTVKWVRSVHSFLPDNQPEKLKIIGSLRDLIDDSRGLLNEEERSKVDSLRPLLEVEELSLEDLPSTQTNIFTDKEGKILDFVMISSQVPLRDGRNSINFAREIGQINTPSGKTFYASSAHIIFAEMIQLMLDDAILAVGLTLAVVTLVLLIDLRRPIDTLLVMTPLLTALIWVGGFMYIFNIKLNLYNMIAFPTMIGMGIDNGVHIFHRYKESGNGSLRLVLRTTGMTLLATSLTTMVGFAGLVPAHHPALHSIGVLSLIGLGCCFITSVTLLPALLQLREKRESLKRFQASDWKAT